VSWQVEKLGNICSFVNGDRGKNYPSTSAFVEEGIPFINAGNLSGNKVDTNKLNFISRDRFDLLSSGKIRKDDFLFCLRGSLGKFAIVENLTEGAIASSLVIIRGNDRITTGYLLEYLRSSLCQNEIEKFGNGAAQPNLSAKDLGEFKIPLPPLNKQKRIAAILDKADSLRRKREQAIELADQFLRSVFLDLFGDPVTNPKGWKVAPLLDQMIHTNNGLSRRRKKMENEGDIVLRLQDIHYDGIRFKKELNRIQLDDKEKSRYLVNNGDMLFVRVNGNPDYVGRSAVFTDYSEPIYHNDHLIRIKLGNAYDSEFLSYCFNFKGGRKIISSQVKTSAGQHTISQGGIEKLEFYRPPIELQAKFVSIMRATKKVPFKNINLGDLFNSLSQKSFAGEL